MDRGKYSRFRVHQSDKDDNCNSDDDNDAHNAYDDANDNKYSRSEHILQIIFVLHCGRLGLLPGGLLLGLAGLVHGLLAEQRHLHL